MKTINIFEEANGPTTTVKANQLEMTAELTRVSELKAHKLIEKISKNSGGVKLLKESFDNLESLKLVVNEVKFNEKEIDLLKGISDEDAIKMLKSQQSKVSRTRSKDHTNINFVTLITAAIAEQLIRQTHQVTKGTRGATGKSITLSDAEYEALRLDQVALGKAVRNVQSKKSTTKTRADFDPESAMWAEILQHELKLKSMRTTPGRAPAAKSEEVIVTDIFKVLAEMDPAERDALIANPDSSELLAKIHEVVDVENEPAADAVVVEEEIIVDDIVDNDAEVTE